MVEIGIVCIAAVTRSLSSRATLRARSGSVLAFVVQVELDFGKRGVTAHEIKQLQSTPVAAVAYGPNKTKQQVLSFLQSFKFVLDPTLATLVVVAVDGTLDTVFEAVLAGRDPRALNTRSAP